MDTGSRIRAFLAGSPFAVVGATDDRSKFGNKVLRCYLQHGMDAHPVNPKGGTIEGRPAWPSLLDVPGPVHAASIITPPPVTLRVVEQAAEAGIRHLWMQPGAESDAAVERAEELGLSVIADGSCLLVVLGYREH